MNLFNNLFGGKNKNTAKVKNSVIDYNQYFSNANFNNTPLVLLALGEVNITTGKIIACDPLVCLCDTLPFTKTVLPGKYPVTACIAKTEKSGDRYAAVKLAFTNENAIRWEMAVVAGQDIAELKEDDEYFGFPVDAGLGCFCDAEAQNLYNQFEENFMQKNPEGNIYDDFFAAEFKKNALNQNSHDDIGDWLNFYLPNKPGLNVIMFHSGYGDGMYPSYWGITTEEKICSLVIDFQVF